VCAARDENGQVFFPNPTLFQEAEENGEKTMDRCRARGIVDDDAYAFRAIILSRKRPRFI
jgi:SOS response regulatory protein OraA/RecX